MATNKKSFVLYCDLLKSVDHLTDKELGVLFRHTLEYVNDMNPVLEDRLLITAWKPIETALKRDLKKYEARAERAKENGKKGGRPKTQKTQSVISKPKKPVSVNDSVSVNDNVKKEDIYMSFDHLTLTNEEHTKLLTHYTKQQIDDTLDSISNYKQNTKYKSLYLTAKSWLKREHPTGKGLRPIAKVVAYTALQDEKITQEYLDKGYSIEQLKEYAL